MHAHDGDEVFAGSIPEVYDTHLVPLIFEPYAAALAARLRARVPAHGPARVLELAAGTGVLTRALAAALPPRVTIVATDLNGPMLDQARAIGTTRPVEWRQADAMRLPFADAAFDAVVCQFGVMFFPDKGAAFAEARRVLRPGGTLLFSVWDRIEENEFADVVTRALQPLFPDDPPRFLARVAHGYHDRLVVETDLLRGGFEAAPRIDVVEERSRAASARIPAVGYCQGTPLRNEIAARDAARLDEATDAADDALTERFGHGAVEGKIQALVVEVQ
jgi:SAM-dependent methyltransferase